MPRGALRACLFACAVALSFAGRARADVILDPPQRGNCAGFEGTVCHTQVRGVDTLGICRKVRFGDVICATDPVSQKEANQRADVLAERSKRETTWVIGVGGAAGAVLLGTVIALLLRRRRSRGEATE